MSSQKPGAQAAWLASYKDTRAHHALDSAFHKLAGHIQTHANLLQKHSQVRVTKWLTKLSEETSNVVWKRNRNAWARLLLAQLRSRRLEDPFHLLPPESALPPVPKHALFAAPVATTRQASECTPGASAAVSSSPPRPETTAAQHVLPAQGEGPDQQLDAYLQSQGVQLGNSTSAGSGKDSTPSTADKPRAPRPASSPVGASEESMTLALAMAREEVRSLEWRLAQTEAALEASKRSSRSVVWAAAAAGGAGRERSHVSGREPAGSKEQEGPTASPAARSPSEAGLEAFAARTAALRAELDRGQGVLPRLSPLTHRGQTGPDQTDLLTPALQRMRLHTGPAQGDGHGHAPHSAPSVLVRQYPGARVEPCDEKPCRSPSPLGPVRHTLKSLASAAAAKGQADRAGQGAWQASPGSCVSPAALQSHALSPAGAAPPGKPRTLPPWESPPFPGTASLQRRLARSINDMLLVGVRSTEGHKALRLGTLRSGGESSR